MNYQRGWYSTGANAGSYECPECRRLEEQGWREQEEEEEAWDAEFLRSIGIAPESWR